MKGLHTLQRAPRSIHRKKRLGRGNASGTGTYSGRGIKGQRARAGGRSGLTARSMRSYLLRIPKRRGDAEGVQKFVIVNVGDLQQHFDDGARVTLKAMREKGLLTVANQPVKVLSHGRITKKLTVIAHQFSAQAKDMIVKAGGSIEELKRAEKKVGKQKV